MTRRTDMALLLLAWVVLYGPLGAVMYLVTAFLFAFSGGQYRPMTPVVQQGFWMVGVVVLLVGVIALARTRTLRRAVRAMLAGAGMAWLVATVVYWGLSSRIGSVHPLEDRFTDPASGFPAEVAGDAAAAGGAPVSQLLGDGRFAPCAAWADRCPR